VADTVSNTSPLIYLHRLRRLELLPLAFGKVIVPSQVDQELARGRERGCDVPELRAQPWIEIRGVALAHDYPELGPGESGALDLARALPDAIVILDDGAARAWAARLGIRSVGTVGILIEAKRHGHIERVAPDLDRLAKLGFRMGPALRQRALAECGEG
jgi:predicted nucleic acid-binding protein